MKIQRIQGIKEANECFVMGKEMHEESSFRDLMFDEEAILHYAFLSMQPDSDLYAAMCVLDSGEAIGFMFGGVESFFFSPTQKLAHDYALYIRKAHRNTMNARGAILLLKDFEHWAKSKRVVRIQLGITTGIAEEKTMKLYNKLGYVSLGQLFFREVI